MSPTAHQPNTALLILECGAAAIAAALAFAWPALGAGWFARVERLFARLARRKNIAAACAGLSVIIFRLAILPALGVPLPFSPDDFSFLLQSDTFLHGRLTNPTPPMWTHFETIHVTMVPSYQSMYFPGQGLLLALGHVLFGHPWFGVLLSSAAMCAALTWALQAWLPANWALLGGFIAVLRLGVFSYWTNTYHAAGSLAALGGALILGALPRLMKTARFRYALAMGIGIAFLVLTRPYEGLLLCLPVAAVLARWMWKGGNRPPAMVLARRAALPLAIVIGAGAWLGYYDLKAFGKATTLPYTLDRTQYAMAPYYVWQHQRPEPHYRHADMRKFYYNEMGFFHEIHTWKGYLPHSLEKVAFALLFYAGFMLLLPLVMLRRVLLDRRVRFLVICLAVLTAGMSIEIYLLAHYVAPFVCAFYAVGLQAMRHLRVWKPEGKPVGLAMARMMVFSCVALAGLRVFAQPLHLAPPELPPSNWNFTWFGPEHFGVDRARVTKELEQLPGGQLAIVRFSPKHDPLDAWVYNSANIDQSKVIWAREMDKADNEQLLRYYGNRKAWLVEPDVNPVRVTPYPEQAGEMKAGN